MLGQRLLFLGIILVVSLSYISASGISINPPSIVQGTYANITISLSQYNGYVYFYQPGSTSPVNVNLNLGCGNNCTPNTYSYNFSSISFSPGNYIMSVFSLDPSNTGWVNSTFTIISGTCTASNGGINYYVGGVVTGPYGSQTDTCLSDGKTLEEYYCSGSNISMSTYVCTNGCSNGYCLPAVCTGFGQTSCGSSCCNSGQACSNNTCVSPQSSYTENSTCGNGVVDFQSGEVCDVNNFTQQDGSIASCASQLGKGYYGSLGCSTDCKIIDTSQCVNQSTSTCSDGTFANQCSINQPYYCNQLSLLGIPLSNYLSYNCFVCGCPSWNCVCSSIGTNCVVASTLQSTISSPPPIGLNQKNSSLYKPNMVFLLSDANWESVLPFVSTTTWTDSLGNINKYPSLIYYDQGQGQDVYVFDASSIINFMQQYSPSKVIIVGNSPQQLDDSLVASPSVGAGLQISQIQRINPQDYLGYWSSFNTVVYVEDNYTLGLLASTYASLIDAPLIIQGSSVDSSAVFSGRNVICVGNVNPSGSSCSQTYTLSQLQNQYVNQTGTNKVVLVNPNDWTNGESLTTVGESQKLISDNVQEIFLKTSLVSPFLASARQELLFSTTQTSDFAINSALKAQISSMNVKYLTIMASPLTIPASQYMYSVGGENIYKSLDQTEYADTNNDDILILTREE